MSGPRLSRFFHVFALLPVATGSCNKQQNAPPPEPPNVTVAHPVEHRVMEWEEYSGYLTSPDTSNVVARVSGLILEATFKEGSMVQKGEVLFVIDDRPFRAELNSKQADVTRGQAQVDLSEATLHRLDKVRQTKAISEEDYDTAKANLEQAQAILAAGKAAQETSKLNLEWTRVTAPISGRVSRQLVQPGNMVNGGSGQSQSTLLTTIVQVDPLYCYVNIPERVAMQFQKLAAVKQQPGHVNVPCFIQLENETGYPHQGVIDFVDNRVDVNTGTVMIRGVIPNADGLVNAGSFARMRIPGSAPYDAILIPDAAIGTEQNERYVLVLAPGNTVQVRRVKLGALFGTMRSIIEGVKPTDAVIVSGLQMARPGAKVNPQVAPISQADLDAMDKSIPATLPAATQPTTAPATGLQS
jgi:multidrug efflux system membrane fusion protein